MADKSSKHEIMKKLLSAPNPPPQISSNNLSKMDIKRNYDSDTENAVKLHTYLEQISGEREALNVVEMDHTYSLPWNWRPDNCFAKPAKRLFVSQAKNVSWSSLENIDPSEPGKIAKPPYDAAKAQLMMEETSRLVSILRPDPGDPDWEAKVDKSDWGPSQTRLFEKISKILHYEHLHRLTYKSNWNEAVLRRIGLDKSARRFRTVMATIGWKAKLIHWLHNVLLENLDFSYLIIYIDILQTLKKKIPQLVDRLISGPVSNKINPDALNILLKKPWDPASTGLSCSKPKRLPGNPLFVVVPYGSSGGSDNTARFQRWLPHLSLIGSVTPVNTNASNKITVVTSLEHMMSATRAKLAELRSDYKGRPIVLFGINAGSALACQVALVEKVSAVVCMGFPVNTVEDKRGQPDDNLLNLNTPTVFVIGQHAPTSYVDDVEDIREKLKVETGLVIVGGADDQLRLPNSKQKAEGVTQSMVDRCIIDEVADFIGTILSTPPQIASSLHTIDNRPRIKVFEKKRKISIQDEIYPKRQLVQTVAPRPGGAVLNVTTNRRGHSGRGRGRSRYITQLTTTSDEKNISNELPSEIRPRGTPGRPRRRLEKYITVGLQDAIKNEPTTGRIAIGRRGGLLDKGITRPSIENISVINTSSINHTTLSGDTPSFKILPHIKVLGSEGYAAVKMEASDDSSLIDQLTPANLLEMPVIIASDSHDDNQDSQLKVVMSSGGNKPSAVSGLTLNNQPVATKNPGDVKCTTIFFRKRGMPLHGTRVAALNVDSRQIRNPRLQHFPASEYSDVQ